MDFKLKKNMQLEQVINFTQTNNGEVHFSIVNGLKKCSCCTYIKPLSEFHKSFWSKDGAQYYCKECSKAENKRARNQKLLRKITQDYHNGSGMFA